jgi:hypothetical protein
VALPPCCVAHECGHIAAEPGVTGAMHLAHASGAPSDSTFSQGPSRLPDHPRGVVGDAILAQVP